MYYMPIALFQVPYSVQIVKTCNQKPLDFYHNFKNFK